MTEAISYAYAVARDDGTLQDALAGLSGVSGASVRLVRVEPGDDLVVAVSPVPERDFAEDALRVHLEDLDWLESTARAHHRVVEALTSHTTVLPLRLVTVYLDDERVRSMLRSRRDAFASRLTELAAQVEWGVKIYVDESAGEVAAEEPADAALSPGRAYLSRRRAQRHAHDDVYHSAEQAAERVESAARAHAVERVRHRPQQGGLASGTGENVTNDAYLVPLQYADDFHADVARAADGLTGVHVEITGPWAPYSFVTPDTPEPRESAAP
ncbi:GvpL/GvpF family gas vesicle protein [Streptomyces sp. NPDC047515]|uniref:GvpL/GvpF family gas vesicle protein n=1 Tax=Streptomyces sp. NPDC047515 TaxID=3155380 RepID=UPI0033EA3467